MIPAMRLPDGLRGMISARRAVSCASAFAVAAMLAGGCSKKVELPKDDYVFAPVTNACRLIELLENPSGEANVVTTKVVDVRGFSAADFRRELADFPGAEVHVWMPGRQHWLLVGHADTNRVSLAAADFNRSHPRARITLIECGTDSTAALQRLADSLNANLGRVRAPVEAGTKLIYTAPPPSGVSLIVR